MPPSGTLYTKRIRLREILSGTADFVSARYIKVSKFGSKNKDSKKAEEKRMKQQLAALARKNEKKKKK